MKENAQKQFDNSNVAGNPTVVIRRIEPPLMEMTPQQWASFYWRLHNQNHRFG